MESGILMIVVVVIGIFYPAYTTWILSAQPVLFFYVPLLPVYFLLSSLPTWRLGQCINAVCGNIYMPDTAAFAGCGTEHVDGVPEEKERREF